METITVTRNNSTWIEKVFSCKKLSFYNHHHWLCIFEVHFIFVSWQPTRIYHAHHCCYGRNISSNLTMLTSTTWSLNVRQALKNFSRYNFVFLHGGIQIIYLCFMHTFMSDIILPNCHLDLLSVTRQQELRVIVGKAKPCCHTTKIWHCGQHNKPRSINFRATSV